MLSLQAAANGAAVYRSHSFGGGERAKALSWTETPAAPATGSQSVRIGASGHVAASGVPGRYVLSRKVMPAQREGLPPAEQLGTAADLMATCCPRQPICTQTAASGRTDLR